VDQRYDGAKEASKFGAVGTIVRSMNLRLMIFLIQVPRVTVIFQNLNTFQRLLLVQMGLNYCLKKLKSNSKLKFYFKQSCEQFDDVLSYNVVGEIKGTEHPDKIMVVGGHLDSWDLADGSHDDGAGVVQSMEVVNIFKNLGYKKHYSCGSFLMKKTVLEVGKI
jgi:hypothetical protein